MSTETKWTEGPWCWREFGGKLMLVTERGGSKIVLCPSRNAVIQTRGDSGVLCRLVEDHDVAHLIATAPSLYEALEAGERLLAGDLVGKEWKVACKEWTRQARAALSRARGETK